MKYLEDSRLTRLTSDLMGVFLNTRGSGGGGGGYNHGGTGGRGRGKGRKKYPGGRGTRGQAKLASYLSYNPEGYSSYGSGSGGPGSTSSGSCRVVYGRVEAYTTKRAGSDKQTAHEVAERYAREMHRLNEAVEEIKRRYALERQKKKEMHSGKGGEGSAGSGANGDDEGGGASNMKIRRQRSRSLDDVAFSATSSQRVIYDEFRNASAVSSRCKFTDGALEPLEEAAVLQEAEDDALAPCTKRNLEGILRLPSPSKRCRATSFDISTGPSTFRTSRGGTNEIISSAIAEDRGTHPLIPQTSLYQSSLSEGYASNGDKAIGPTMVPRRLVTDLILTLNASFPDYDFCSAQVSDFCTLSSTETMKRINEKLGEFAATTDKGRDFLPRLWSSLDDILGGLGGCEVYSYAPNVRSGEDDPLEFLTASMAAAGDENGNSKESNVIVRLEPTSSTVLFSPTDGEGIVSAETFGSPESLFDLPNQISLLSGGDPPHVTLWSMNYLFVSRSKKRIVLFACVQTMRTPHGNDDEHNGEEVYDYDENNIVFDEARRIMHKEEKSENDDVYYQDAAYPLMRIDDMIGSSSLKKAEFSFVGGDESASVMVEDTDVEDGVDVDGEIDRGEDDFDTGALGITAGIPSLVA